MMFNNQGARGGGQGRGQRHLDRLDRGHLHSGGHPARSDPRYLLQRRRHGHDDARAV